MRKFFTRDRITELLQITLGVFLMTAGFYFFLSPCQLVVGGVTGLSIIFDYSFGFSETIMVYILNIICLLMGLIFFSNLLTLHLDQILGNLDFSYLMYPYS